MPLFKRILFYFSGVLIGVVLLFFFLGGSGASCEYDYGPNSRTLKNIRNKELVYSEKALKQLNNQGLDTAAVSLLLQHGDVLFSESNTQLDSCKIYVITHEISEKNLKIQIENCEKTASVLEITNH
ncbi:MAG: hypothetical protein K0U54_09095 [Bacteroidetes bacterium]|nr:hypothetical protein [Bacteroidota bacterium]